MKTVAVSQLAREVLGRSLPEGNRLVLVGQLDRAVYTEINKVLEALGGKWNRSAKAHVFPSDAAALIAPLLADDPKVRVEKVVDTKKSFDVFETPAPIVARMIESIELATSAPITRILEPSAGSGRLVVAAREKFPLANITAVELRACEIAGTPDHVVEGDFLAVEPWEVGNRPMDLVLANPPFSNSQDIKHLIHMMSFAHPKAERGQFQHSTQIVCLTAPSWRFRTTKMHQRFRHWFDEAERNGRASYEEVDAGAFSDEGTEIKTLLLHLWVTTQDYLYFAPVIEKA